MAATFRTRPWLLASATRPIFTPASRGLMANMEHGRRSYAAARSKKVDPYTRASMKQMQADQRSQKATSTLNASIMQSKLAITDPIQFAVLAPRTLVPVPPSKLPPGLKNKFLYYKEILWLRMQDRAQIFAQTWRFKPSIFKSSPLRMRRKGLVQTALDLHASMSQSLAAGTPEAKAQLSRICVPKLARNLVAVIESRPRGKSYRWERLGTPGWPFWPRVVDHKWQEINVGVNVNFRQAVVGIRSKQRLTELDAKGKEVGSKVMDLTEYVVLWRQVHVESQTQGDWLVYGTLKESSFDDVMKETKMFKKWAELKAEEQLHESQRKLSKKK